MKYIWENSNWPDFHWDEELINAELQNVRFVQGQLLGIASTFGFDVKNVIEADSITDSVIHSSEIEGISLNFTDVRSSVVWQLGIEPENQMQNNRYIDGFVEAMFDEKGAAVDSAPHPQQILYLQLSEACEKYDLLRVKKM